MGGLKVVVAWDTTVHPEGIIVRIQDLHVLESSKLLYSIPLGNTTSGEYSTASFGFMSPLLMYTHMVTDEFDVQEVHLPSVAV